MASSCKQLISWLRKEKFGKHSPVSMVEDRLKNGLNSPKVDISTEELQQLLQTIEIPKNSNGRRCSQCESNDYSIIKMDAFNDKRSCCGYHQFDDDACETFANRW